MNSSSLVSPYGGFCFSRNAIAALIIPNEPHSILMAEALCHAVNFGCLRIGTVNSSIRLQHPLVTKLKSADLKPFSSIFEASPVECPFWLLLAEDWTEPFYHYQAMHYGDPQNIHVDGKNNDDYDDLRDGTIAPRTSSDSLRQPIKFEGFDLISSVDMNYYKEHNDGQFASKYRMILLLIEVT